jgi:ribosomal protein S18 acetylase RimI-like enzyme
LSRSQGGKKLSENADDKTFSRFIFRVCPHHYLGFDLHPKDRGAMNKPPISCRKAMLDDPEDAKIVVNLLDLYASDPMGGGQSLPNSVKIALPKSLAQRPSIHVILATLHDETAGIAVCIESFSTFACKPVLNIHDLAVIPSRRRRGIGGALLLEVEKLASELDCCKLTLEVLSKNFSAQHLYTKYGFKSYDLKAQTGPTFFWQKKLRET